jgi:hypothetical protein
MVMNTAAFEVAPLRVPEGMIVYLKHLESAWVFRIMPIRDPDQPRLWCLRLEACAAPSLSARTAPFDPYYTALAMTREQLAETLTSLRTRTATWIDDPAQRDLRRWLAGIVRLKVPENFAAPPPSPRSRQVPTEARAEPGK